MTWPPHALTLTTPALTLRGMTEADALALAEVVPEDLEHSPRLPSFSPAANVLQAYWTQAGQWRTDDWVLPFVVLHEGQRVGVQALEGKGFLARRTLDSFSWLLPSARGRGLGKQMRAAVLALGFERLAAQYAGSEAWSDNAASLGVSRALGYRDNGVEVHAGPRLMQRMLLTREEWTCPWPVTITGLDACLPLLGLEAAG